MAYYFICDFTGETINNQKFCAAGCPIAIGDFYTTGALPTEIHIADILNLEVYLTLGKISKGNVTPLNSLFEGAYGECCHAGVRDIGCGQGVPSLTCGNVYRTEPESGCCLQRIVGNWKTRKLFSAEYSYDWPSVNKGYLLFSFKGTIEQLLGRKLKPGESEVTINLVTAYLNVYLLISAEHRVFEHIPFQETIAYSKFVDIKGPTLNWTVKILNPVPPPSPPEPIFVADLCDSPPDTEPLAPDEEFQIKVTIVNQNQYYGGKYYIGSYCKGHYMDLGSGTISAGQQKTQTFTTTANTLAGTQITADQYLTYYIVTGYFENSAEKETDRWSPPTLAVIVGPVPPPGTASLSGKVTDSETGSALSGVTVKDGLATTTAANGNYSFTGLKIGSHTIKFSKDGYKSKEVAKYLYEGDNSLNAELTPGAAIPWKWIGIGGGIVTAVGGGLALLLRRRRRK